MEQLIKALRSFSDERDWAKFHNPKDLAVSVSIEAGELLENFQWQPEGAALSDSDRARIADEASDVLIYTLMLMDKLQLDAAAEVYKKLDRNAARFPVEKAFGRPGWVIKRTG